MEQQLVKLLSDQAKDTTKEVLKDHLTLFERTKHILS